jgi:hypothetical protein
LVGFFFLSYIFEYHKDYGIIKINGFVTKKNHQHYQTKRKKDERRITTTHTVEKGKIKTNNSA